MRDDIWSLIRETRSSRPGKAAEDANRASVYGAALQQFEELMQAAARSGYTSRPLPLFYAVSQAGRAIAAAWGEESRLSGHGLKPIVGPTPLHWRVKADPGKSDSFSRVAAATHQGSLTNPVELGALWASLPDLYGQGIRDEPWRRPLVGIREDEHDPGVAKLMGKATRVTIQGLPAELLNVDEGDRDAVIEAELEHYPSLAGWQPWRPQGLRPEHPSFDSWNLRVTWEAESAAMGARDFEFQGHFAQHRIGGTWWARPCLNDEGDFLGPLMTWWALLFGLSMLARYYPAEWTAGLRVDESVETVPLETALDRALIAVPHFVLEALRGEHLVGAV